MKRIYLPGYSPKNEDELVSITNALSAANFPVYGHRWSHWGDESVEFDVNSEIASLTEQAGLTDGEEIGVIAKSIGTFTAMHLWKSEKFNIRYFILLGLPLASMPAEDTAIFPELVPQITVPMHVIQNENDPAGPVSLLRSQLTSTNFELTIKQADDHRYNYPQDVVDLVQKLENKV